MDFVDGCREYFLIYGAMQREWPSHLEQSQRVSVSVERAAADRHHVPRAALQVVAVPGQKNINTVLITWHVIIW